MSRAKGRAVWLPDVLRDAGLTVKVVDGWATRGRDPKEWISQTNHHTASSPKGGNAPSLSIVTHGRPDVPGPLANTLPARDGTIYVVASGAANHPGVAYLPLRGGISSGVKYWSLGHEIELSGVGEPFPTNGRLYEVVHRMNAAICAYLGHDPLVQLFDHKTIARPHGRKIDVHPYNLAAGRARTRQILTPTTTKEFRMDAQAKAAFAALNRRLDAQDKEIAALKSDVRRAKGAAIYTAETSDAGRKAGPAAFVKRIHALKSANF